MLIVKLVSGAKSRSIIVSTRGRITIPSDMRKAMGIKKGDKMIFIIDNGQVTMSKVSRQRLAEILRKQKPWQEHSVKFQKRMRKEWS